MRRDAGYYAGAADGNGAGGATLTYKLRVGERLHTLLDDAGALLVDDDDDTDGAS